MSQPLVKSIEDNIGSLHKILHNVKSSGLEFGFTEEQLSFQLEALIFEFSEAVDEAIKIGESDE